MKFLISPYIYIYIKRGFVNWGVGWVWYHTPTLTHSPKQALNKEKGAKYMSVSSSDKLLISQNNYHHQDNSTCLHASHFPHIKEGKKKMKKKVKTIL